MFLRAAEVEIVSEQARSLLTSDGLQHLLVVEDAFRSFSQVIKEISNTPLLVQLQRSAKINFKKKKKKKYLAADSVIYYNHY